jgi:transposase InsO family protein
MDYVGPFPEDEFKNSYILVIIDTFTRATGLYPVPAADGPNAARSLLHFIGYFGCPSQIVSDRGSHFVNDIIREFMSLMGTDHKLTLAYSKEENAMVENANKRVQEYLRDIMFERRIINKWSIALPIVQRILMTDRNKRSNRNDSSRDAVRQCRRSRHRHLLT